MTDRSNLIAQLAVLKQKYADTGETVDQLVAHFQSAMDNREIVMIQEKGQVVAFCDWSWIDSVEDIQKVDQGEPTNGHILHVINLVCVKPGLIWKLKALLPFYLHITGQRNGKLHAPKGLPDEARDLMEVY